MKHVLFMAAASAAMVLASCGDNEITQVGREQVKTPISYAIHSQGQTRVTATDASYTTLQTEGFALIATSSVTGSSSAFYEKASYNSGKWTTATEHYWPLNSSEKLKFYGFYPDPSSTYVDGATIKNISIMGETDMLAAKNESPTVGSDVQLSFQHVLAKVEAKITYNNGNATLTKLTLGNGDGTTGGFSGTYDLATQTWTVNPSGGGETPYELFSGSMRIGGTATAVTGSLMLLPGTYQVEATIDADVATGITRTGTVQVVAGSVNTLNLVIGDGSTSFVVGETITDWDTNDVASQPLK